MIQWLRDRVIRWGGMTTKPLGPDGRDGNQAGAPPFHTRRPFHFLRADEIAAFANAALPKAVSLCWYDNYDGVEIPCRHCRRPVLLRKGGGAWDSLQCDYVVHSCPACGSSAAHVYFPHQAEAIAAGDKSIVHTFERRKARNIEFQRHCLKGPEQLPNIEAGQFTLDWDTIEQEGKESWTVIRLNREEIFREFAFWENGERYGQVASILKAKYGDRLKDLVPTYAGWRWLGGDSLYSLRAAQEARKNVFGLDAF